MMNRWQFSAGISGRFHRNTQYYVKGDFGEDIEVKINAVDILQRELPEKQTNSPEAKLYDDRRRCWDISF